MRVESISVCLSVPQCLGGGRRSQKGVEGQARSKLGSFCVSERKQSESNDGSAAEKRTSCENQLARYRVRFFSLAWNTNEFLAPFLRLVSLHFSPLSSFENSKSGSRFFSKTAGLLAKAAANFESISEARVKLVLGSSRAYSSVA